MNKRQKLRIHFDCSKKVFSLYPDLIAYAMVIDEFCNPYEGVDCSIVFKNTFNRRFLKANSKKNYCSLPGISIRVYNTEDDPSYEYLIDNPLDIISDIEEKFKVILYSVIPSKTEKFECGNSNKGKSQERNTVFQVIDNLGNVIYSNTYLCECKKWVKKHFTFNELSGRGAYVTMCDKVMPNNMSSDYLRASFPEFDSISNGLFRRYVMQTIVTPASPEAIFESKCVAYIINSFHENHYEIKN